MSFLVGSSFIFIARGSHGLPVYVSLKNISDYKTNIEAEKKDIDKVESLIEDAQTKLGEYEKLAGNTDDKLQKKMIEELEFYKMASGEASVKGSGVEVLVDDGTRDLYEGENVNNIMVHDWDILRILNELKRAGAEAISVNGQRIINTSAISCAGYTIRINGQTYARPFEIKAIGDAKRMASTLVAPEGIATELKFWGVICKVTIKDNITIPSYTENQTYKYITKVMED